MRLRPVAARRPSPSARLFRLSPMYWAAVSGVVLLILTVRIVMAPHRAAAHETPHAGPPVGFAWERAADERLSPRVTWILLQQRRYEGLTNEGWLSEVEGPIPGLRDGLGMLSVRAPHLVWMEKTRGRIISSPAQLNEAFGPVETVEKAVAFVLAEQSSLSGDENGVFANVAEAHPGEFWVHVRQRTGSDVVGPPVGRVYAVTRDGTVRRIAIEPLENVIRSEVAAR